MKSTPLQIRTHAELVAIVPHLLGFEPEDSLVCVPAGRPGPIARIDHPHTEEDMVQAAQALTHGYAGSPGPVVMVAFTDQPAHVRQAVETLGREAAGVLSIVDTLRVHDQGWVSLTTGETGAVPGEVVSRFAADAVVAGRTLPAHSRDSLADQLHGDPAPVAAHLPAARARADALSNDGMQLMAEAKWITATVARFTDDQIPLHDADAARMLADIQQTSLRDAAWLPMTQHEASTHVALWSDLTRRAPEEVRTPAAGLLGFASWLSGDGARAWVAIDQIPDPSHHRLAQLVATALTNGVPPEVWRAAGSETAMPVDAPERGHGPSRLRDRDLYRGAPSPGQSPRLERRNRGEGRAR